MTRNDLAPPGAPSRGYTATAFSAVRDAFDEMLAADPGYSAQLSVAWQGRTVIDLQGGSGLAENSLTGVYSSSKGAAAVVIGLLIDRGELDLDSPVSTYWPDFAARDKASITVRTLLSHRAGVIGVEEGFSAEDMIESSRAAAKLAAAPPVWQPGTAHGYHALSIGVIMEELTRRVTGTTLQSIYETEIRAPRDIEFYLGLPDAQESRYREVLPPAPTPDAPPGPEWRATDSVQALAFNVLHSELSPFEGDLTPNNPAIRAAGIAAIGGVGSARGLAGVYSAVLGGPDQPPLLSASTIEQMSRQQAFGLDRVLGMPNSFGVVFMKPHPNLDFGSYRAFGHDGAGGALGFADPIHDVAFGYVPLPMQPPGGADPKAVRLSQLVRQSIRAQLS